MAYSEEGLFGKFSGKLGSLVVYKMNGKTVVRARPGKWTAKPSPQQQLARDNFVRVVQVIKAISPFINITYGAVQERSAFRNALSVNLKSIREHGSTSPEQWLQPSRGIRAGASGVTAQVTNQSIIITWAEASGPIYSGDDKVMLLALNIRTLDNTISQTAHRNDYRAEVSLPGTPDEVVVYLCFVKRDFQRREEANVSQAQWLMVNG